MKRILFLLIIFSYCPLFASVNCLDNSKHLQEDYDDKEWHAVACDCPCTTIKGKYCIECGHLQNASTYIVVLPTKVAQQEKTYMPSDPKAVFKKLALEYLQSKSSSQN